MIGLIVVANLASLPCLVWKAEGRAEAERDIASDAMKWKIYGHMAGLRAIDTAAGVQLRERFGVELTAVAQCVVTHELVGRAEGYNERIREEVGRRHGADAIDRVWEEAYQETRPVNVAGAWLLRLSAAAGGLSGLWVCRRLLMRGRR